VDRDVRPRDSSDLAGVNAKGTAGGTRESFSTKWIGLWFRKLAKR
jgi:hypothetical protein